MYACSSGGENGTGVSGAAIRFTGASSDSNPSSAIVAAISAPKPPVRVLDRARQQSLRVLGRRRADALQPGDVSEGAFRVLGMEGAARETAPGGQPDDDRDGCAGPVELLLRDGDQVVPGAGDEVGE